MFISVLVAAMVCFAMWERTEHRLLLWWFAVIFVLAGARVVLMQARQADLERDRHATRWERHFIITLTLTSLAWGLGGWWIMPPDSFTDQAVVYFFLIGMAGGTQASYSAHVRATTIAIGCLMLPATLWFLFQDAAISRAMALGGFIYMAAAYRATRTLSYFVHHSFQLTNELRVAHAHAQQLARTDGLTSLMNRRAFYEFAGLLVGQASRAERRLSALMLDLDHFKAINDTHGHAAGDEILKAVGGAIKDTARATDLAGRLGGEEFGLLLADTAAADALALAERLRQRASEIVVRHGDAEVRVTCSLGVAECTAGCRTLDALLAKADEALYRAKHAGRNRVELAH